ncbi:hypothetical protein SAMN06295879_0014 [Agreia bicolorata]|uniref:Uncharacterized protein n=1 Tax=Agreia bicolorata TaxID=110935 RepID=A0A1T4WQV0_9MICO|nr:hypothetical protein [Agreia bicolorata]SKA79238.1 hypothetical protein SAMN06295879_0014 [Agreia bicolorata]
MRKALSTASGIALAVGLLAVPTTAHAVSYYGTWSATSSAACNAEMKAYKANGYSVTACRQLNGSPTLWYFQYGH